MPVKRKTAIARRELVADALDWIQRDLDTELGLESLAERAGVSAFHFHRVFRESVGEPPAAYVRRLRLERAALSLKYSRRPVTDIAFEAGYESHEAFTRAFAARFGAAPCRFRAEESCGGIEIAAQPTILRIPPRRIACVRHVGPYDETGPAFEKVLSWAGRRGLLRGANLLAVYWDDQRITPPDRTRCEVGLYVNDDATGDDDVEIRHLAGGEHAVLRFQGPAQDRRQGYDLLYGRWLRERGREPANAPPYEEYLPFGGDLDALDLVADVHVPLAPKPAA